MLRLLRPRGRGVRCERARAPALPCRRDAGAPAPASAELQIPVGADAVVRSVLRHPPPSHTDTVTDTVAAVRRGLRPPTAGALAPEVRAAVDGADLGISVRGDRRLSARFAGGRHGAGLAAVVGAGAARGAVLRPDHRDWAGWGSIHRTDSHVEPVLTGCRRRGVPWNCSNRRSNAARVVGDLDPHPPPGHRRGRSLRDRTQRSKRCGGTTTRWRCARAQTRTPTSSCGAAGCGRCATWSRTGWRPGPGGPASPRIEQRTSGGARGRRRPARRARGVAGGGEPGEGSLPSVSRARPRLRGLRPGLQLVRRQLAADPGAGLTRRTGGTR